MAINSLHDAIHLEIKNKCVTFFFAHLVTPTDVRTCIRRYILWDSEWWHRNCNMYIVHVHVTWYILEYNKCGKNELSCEYIRTHTKMKIGI